MQDNPDPDAIASALAIREIIHEKLRKRAVIGYGGTFGRAENRAMVHALSIEARPIATEDVAKYKTIILVDTQPKSGNNILPSAREADIVIDHHMMRKKAKWSAALADVRTEYGAASTIVYEYLVAAGITPAARLATALFYGIQSDTQELGRETSPADIQAFQELFLAADKTLLARIRRAPLDAEYFCQLRDALERSQIADGVVFTSLPTSNNPDIYAELADLLLRLESVRCSVCFGPSGDTIQISARSVDARSNTADRMSKVVDGLGTGGGHATMAGGQVPLKGEPGRRMQLVQQRIIKHFGRGAKPKRLLPEPCDDIVSDNVREQARPE